MASVTDSAGRTSGSGIVLAGDRSASRKAAVQHSRNVRILKFLLPVSTLLVISGYAYSVVNVTGWGKALDTLEVPQIVADNLAMENPHYEGFNNDGGRYWVTAKKAIQDIKSMSLIKLQDITGELIDANKQRTRLTATRGTFNNKENIVELFDTIDIAGENGLKAKLTRATIKTKENLITSDQPVEVAMPAGVVTADQMTVRQKSKEYTFVQNVRTNLKGREPDPNAPPPEANSLEFGNSSQPITITSNRLDVNDATKVALFTGTVQAAQGQATLSSPELEVTYEGSAVPEQHDPKVKKAADTPVSAPTADQGGKVKRVVAKSPVTMTQGNGQQVTSRSADFDAQSQKAVLDGDVVMTELSDRRVVGDRAEIDQAAGTVLLTGPVILTQGKNELRGRRLFANRSNGKMNLTAAGWGNGRISARFFQQNAGQAGASKKGEQPKGLAFSGSFRTDPNAPVDVASDRLDVDDHVKQAVFTGDVKAQQAGFNLASAELIATYSGAAGFGVKSSDPKAAASAPPKDESAKLTRLQAKKNVEVTSKDGQKATGDWADYDTKNNTVTLGGNVVMTQGKNIVRGTKLVIDMTSGESVISTETTATSASPPMTSSQAGDQSGMIVKSGRPSAVFYPNEIKDRAAKAAGAAASGWQSRSDPSH